MKHKNKILFALFLLALGTPLLALAQQGLPLPDASNYGDIIAPVGEDSVEKATGLLEGIIRNFKLIAGIIAIAIIIILAIRMLMAQGSEDELKKARTGMLWTILALALISLAVDVGKILDPSGGGILKDPNEAIKRVQLFDYKVDIIITFIKYLLGSIAVIFLLRNGLRFIGLSGNEEEVTKDKKNLGASVVGLILIYVGDTLINKVFYVLDKSGYPSTSGVKPGVDAAAGVAEIVAFTNFAVFLTAPIAIAVLVAGAIMYITAAGEEERMTKAKRMVVSAVVGLIVIYGAFAIVSEFIPDSVTVEI